MPEEEMVSRRTLLTNTVWKFGERIIAQLVSLVISVVLARILMPEDYGLVSMVLIFITIANVLVTDGIPSSLVQKKDSDDKDFSSVFYLNIVLSIVLYLALFFTAGPIESFFNTDGLALVLRVLGIQIIMSSIKSVIHSYVAKNFMFKKFFWATIIGTIISGVVGIVMAYNGFGVWALVAQYLINTFIDTVILWIVVKWKPILYFSFKRIKKLFSFGWKMLFEGVSNVVFGELQSFIIGRVYTSSDLAFYKKGQQFPQIIVSNACSAVSSVLFPAFSKIQDEKEKVLFLLRRSVRLFSYILFPMMVGLFVVAKPFITVLLTEKWLDAVPFLQITCIVCIISVGLYPRHQAMTGTGRSGVFMIEHFAARIVGVVLLVIFYKTSVLAIALTGIGSAVVLAITVLVTSKVYNGYRIRDQLLDILPITIGCVLFGVPVYFLGMLDISPYIVLTIQVITGIVIYLLYSWIFKIPEFKFCINCVKKVLNFRKKGKTEGV